MGRRNYLIEGVSGTGKSSVCEELRNRGYHAVNGDVELAYQGDPLTGLPTTGFTHEHHIWDVAKVKAIVEDHGEESTFFCGGSRNFDKFIDFFDKVFVLNVDKDTLERRIATRSNNDWGGRQAERELIFKLHATQEDVPAIGIRIDATAPLQEVVDEILRQAKLNRWHP